MDGIFREIEEDLGRERYLALWRKYRLVLALAVVAGLVVMAGVALRTAHEREQNGQVTGDYLRAITGADGKREADPAALRALLAEADGTLGALVSMRLSGLGEQEDGTPRPWWSGGDVPPLYRAMAGIQEGYRRLAAGGAGSALELFREVEQAPFPRLAPLAREGVALSLIALGRNDEAAAELEKLEGEGDAGPLLRARAADLLSWLGRDTGRAAAPAAAAPADVPAPVQGTDSR